MMVANAVVKPLTRSSMLWRGVRLIVGATVCWGLALGTTVWPETVTVRVQDQNGADIDGSAAIIEGVRYHNGDSVDLAPRTHAVTIVPGQTSLDLEWATANVTFQVKDQYGVDIPETLIGVDCAAAGPAPLTALVPVRSVHTRGNTA